MLHIPTKRPLFAGGTADLLRDDFNGSTLNENLWTKTDTGGNISVSGGNLVLAGGTSAWGDSALVSVQSWPRKAGLTIEWQITPGATNTYSQCGFTASPLPADQNTAHAIYPASGVLYVTAGAAIITPLSYSAAQVLWARLVCLATGAYYYVSTDGKATWSLIWADDTVTTTPLYAFIESYDAALTADQARVYHATPKPAISGTPAAPVPAYGAELATGNLVVGTWYVIKATEVDHFFTGCAIDDTFRATATTALDANNKVKAITLASTLTLASDPGTRSLIADSHSTLTAGTQCGHWVWVDDETNPLFGALAYHDGTNAHLDKLVNGTPTSLISAAAAYVAGAELRTVVVGTRVALYYNGTVVGTTQTIADAWPAGGTRVCKFSTLSTNDGGVVTVRDGIGV